jgi:hypothetical protein
VRLTVAGTRYTEKYSVSINGILYAAVLMALDEWIWKTFVCDLKFLKGNLSCDNIVISNTMKCYVLNKSIVKVVSTAVLTFIIHSTY